MTDTCIIDFDGTAFNTIKAICKMYDDDYGAYKDYQYIDWEDVHTWNFTELSLSPPERTDLYFNQKRFFDFVETMPGFEKALDRLKQDYKIVFCSIGSYPNIKLKEAFLKFKYPFADFIGVDMAEYNDKSHIDMKDAIYIDDSADMLSTSNAMFKICYGRRYPWNDEWQGIWCSTWQQTVDFIEEILQDNNPVTQFCHLQYQQSQSDDEHKHSCLVPSGACA